MERPDEDKELVETIRDQKEGKQLISLDDFSVLIWTRNPVSERVDRSQITEV